jgi:Skp family chaperone for outer membrane proteins
VKATLARPDSNASVGRSYRLARFSFFYADLATERGKYMQKCKKIREGMSDEYDSAAKRGISKKLLKKIVKEREYDRKIEALTADLEEDERSELDMLMEKLGDFANTALGKAAVASAATAGNGAQAATGA